MDKELEDWLSECIEKGTFENKKDALEFCVGAVRQFCIMQNITSSMWRDSPHIPEPDNANEMLPIKWSVWGPMLKSFSKDFDKPFPSFIILP